MNRKLAVALACALVMAITASEASAHRWRGRWIGGPRYYNNYGYGRGWSNYQYYPRYSYPSYSYPSYNYGYSYPGYYSYSTPYYYSYPGSYYYGGPGISFYYGY